MGLVFLVCVSHLKLKKEGREVIIFEKNSKIMSGSSKNNHNRIHFGFHYPRSLETAQQSLEGYSIFFSIFKDCIFSDFKNYYLIEKKSKVSSKQYEFFCKRLDVFYETGKYPVIDINLETIENSFLTKEPIFDYNLIESFLLKKIEKYGIEIRYKTEISSLKQLENYENIINCTYSNINTINRLFNIPLVKLKIQDVIVPIFELQEERIGLTIMDGDFCSILPKGNEKNIFLLYHVKYSVIKNTVGYFVPNEWRKDDTNIYEKINRIYKESEKYFTFLKRCKRISYWRSYRVLPINNNDERLSYIYENKVGKKYIFCLIWKNHN